MVPNDWKALHLRSLISSLDGGVSVNGEDRQKLPNEKGVLRVSAVSNGEFSFRIKEGVDADFDFFRHYFEAGLLNEEISGIAQEGARNHGLLNVGIGDFFKLRLHVPPAPVQRKIAEAINVAEAEERLFEYQLERFQIEKRALMQQLLTGKRRVKLDQPAEAAP
ncbi:MAG: hypothetical protein Q8M09_18220 [Pseudomonadota bacterium]|nr:hypothetical protein [Pseudomonadota bacterium]MDP1572916.1 hypothetical protein [Pseudomonadota bacterium]MDP1906152.1 hypothetical protein [Pseudomonadota bacterium]